MPRGVRVEVCQTDRIIKVFTRDTDPDVVHTLVSAGLVAAGGVPMPRNLEEYDSWDDGRFHCPYCVAMFPDQPCKWRWGYSRADAFSDHLRNHRDEIGRAWVRSDAFRARQVRTEGKVRR